MTTKVQSMPVAGVTSSAGVVSTGSQPAPAAARMGYLPVPLEQVLVAALDTVPVFLQTAHEGDKRFTLYSSESAHFSEFHRKRLLEQAVRFIYVPMACHSKFQQQMERELEVMASSPTMALNKKSALIYQTSLALIDEVLTEGVGGRIPRLASVSRSVSKLVMGEAKSFSHLFATAQHDYYTATHMVNVGTWMTSLAFAMGISAPEELETICTSGMVHDVGKQSVPQNVLNKAERLSDEDWAQLRGHPTSGAEQLKREGVTNEMIIRVTEEHHERMDGTGYPRGLKGDQIHPISKLCAVIDSFDAMTAARPFKNRVRSTEEAIEILKSETPAKYDPVVVDAWVDLLKKSSDGRPPAAGQEGNQTGRRRHERFLINCPMVARELTQAGDAWVEGAALAGTAGNISKGGAGLILDKSLTLAGYLRICLKGKGTLKDRVVEGQVMRSRKCEDGMFDIGVRFCKPGEQEAAASAAK